MSCSEEQKTVTKEQCSKCKCIVKERTLPPPVPPPNPDDDDDCTELYRKLGSCLNQCLKEKCREYQRKKRGGGGGDDCTW